MSYFGQSINKVLSHNFVDILKLKANINKIIRKLHYYIFLFLPYNNHSTLPKVRLPFTLFIIEYDISCIVYEYNYLSTML